MKNKLITSIIVFIFIILIGNSVQAWIFAPDGIGYFATTTYNGDLFCMQMGGRLKANSLKSGISQGDTEGDYCSQCEEDPPPIRSDSTGQPNDDVDEGEETVEVAYTSEYKMSTTIDYRRYQEVAYALAFCPDKEKVQTTIWQTVLNQTGIKTWEQIKAKHNPAYYDDGLAEQAKNYKEYYERLMDEGGFQKQDLTNYEEVKTSVNTEDDTYVIGKFNIQYTEYSTEEIEGDLIEHYEDSLDDVQKFGYIKNMILKDQDGNTLEIVDIINANTNESILNRATYKYPHSEEEFYIKFKYDGTGKAAEVHLEIEFKYLKECIAIMSEWSGSIYEWKWVKVYDEGSHHHNCYTDDDGEKHHFTYDSFYYEVQKSFYDGAQDLLETKHVSGAVNRALPVWETDNLITDTSVDITMDLEGIVFLDIASGKSTVDSSDYDGIYDKRIDKPMENIEVTLYEEGGEVLATLYQKEGEIRTNATLTDADGHFAFKGLDAQKKYYVTYKFNGQKYENSTYKVAIADYNTGAWEVTSKASILDADRLAYNNKFEMIHSHPDNYSDINNITGFKLSTNKTYKIYEQTYDKGQEEFEEMETLQNAINDKIKNFINSNKKYPNSNSEKKAIYQAVASENSGIPEVKNKIQYIVDMEIIAKTGYKSKMQYYPVYNQFVIDTVDRTIAGVEYKAIYDGQRFINLGLMQREKLDLTLYKDLIKVTIYINNKRYVYDYNSRKEEGLEVTIKDSDFNSVQYAKRGTDISDRVNHSNLYDRELRDSDVAYIDYLRRTGQDYSKRMRIFVTYRIRVRNFTDGAITANVTELRDHFDNDYEYRNDRNSSVITYDVLDIPEVQKTENDKYELVKTAGDYLSWGTPSAGTPTNTIKTVDSKMGTIGLKTGEYFDVYNMFEVKTEAIEEILDTKETTKENYAQIASYRSYYTKSRQYSDGDTITRAGYVAGLVDRDSRPGDFDANSTEVQNFVKESYTPEYQGKGGEEKTQLSRAVFEDDADKAPGINLKILSEYRILKGNVWEDKILADKLKENNIRQGDGLNNDAQAIQKLRVQLIDMDRDASIENNGTIYSNYNTVTDLYDRTLSRGNDFVPATTLTDENGNYKFEGYVPGNYLVRFIYGEQELLTANNNGKVYEGEDYKSTLYTESDHNFGTEEDPSYWYETTKAQTKSDAQDNLVRRNEINNINRQMQFHDASVLNYYENRDSGYLTELENKTKLFADTTKLILEVEYVQRESDYDKDVPNRVYVVEKVDFGLAERPRSELTITKDVENIRIIANSGQTIFDAEQSVNNLGWIKPIKNLTGNYNTNYDRNGMIQATVDDNLMHGSTIKILYRITVENTGEKDYLTADQKVDKAFYNTAIPSPSAQLATTKADCILDYVENNLKFSNELDAIDRNKEYNKNWELVIGEDDIGKKTNKLDTVLKIGNDSLIDPSLSDTIKKYDTIIRTTSSSPLLKELNPAGQRTTNENDNSTGEKVSDTLLLTKVLDTSDNSDDSFVYDNGIEIVQTTNQAGRRHYNNKDKSRFNEDDQITKDQIISSIPGNYVPTNASDVNRNEKTVTTEPDSDYAERITVLVPFGANNYMIITAVSILAIAILGVGIVLIKKKVLKK